MQFLSVQSLTTHMWPFCTCTKPSKQKRDVSGRKRPIQGIFFLWTINNTHKKNICSWPPDAATHFETQNRCFQQIILFTGVQKPFFPFFSVFNTKCKMLELIKTEVFPVEMLYFQWLVIEHTYLKSCILLFVMLLIHIDILHKNPTYRAQYSVEFLRHL